MEVSENWLREWIHPDISSIDLQDQILRSGLELEKIIKVKCLFKNIVVGEIVSYYFLTHLNKSLISFEIKISNNRTINILSDIIKFFIGMKVAVATTESKLASDKIVNLLTIQNKKFTGIICSFKDLGILNIKNCIVNISSNIPIGTDLSQFLMFNDNILRISSTPNRADALSILGIARDISAFNNSFLLKPKKYIINSTISDQLAVEINLSSDICSRFFGRIIKNVNCCIQTPIWLLERLRRSSIKSCNVVIDIINYVLVELGQPVYVFDTNNISGKLIQLRKSYNNETYVDLNKKIKVLNNNTIVISDKQKILMLGGHVESYDGLVSDNSTNLFLGCAFFNPFNYSDVDFEYGSINFFTERYIRGIDPNMQYQALEYVTYLILKVCGGYSGAITVSQSKKKHSPNIIKLFQKNLIKYIGCNFDSTIIPISLSKFGYEVKYRNTLWLITVPSWRFDIKIEEDIISELIRIIGYKKLLSTSFSISAKINNNNDLLYNSLYRTKLLLVDLGYNEIITYGFVDPKIQKLLFPKKIPLCLINPISSQMSSMRLSLITGLLSHILYNQNRQEKVIRCFESGLCFFSDTTKELGISQNLHLSGAISGYSNEASWNAKNTIVNYYDLKQDLELILEILGQFQLVQFKNKNISSGFLFHESATIYLNNCEVGFIGVINSNLANKLGLKYKTIVFELIWHKIAIGKDIKIEPISKYPRSIRDIALIIDEKIEAGKILSECYKVSEDNIISIKVVDIFRGRAIGLNKKSVALRLTFENKLKTLTEQEISIYINKCVKLLHKQFNAVLRDGKS